MSTIRLLDLGLVPPVRSQTIYHAVAYALEASTPDTIILVGPERPYVCIGYHQELEREVDTVYCRAHGLPVYRREVGGGAVYLDQNQVFTQWVFQRSALPEEIGERFAFYVKPLVETYRTLGIPASYRPINDIHVDGRKIGGTGAAQMGEAEVVVGSLMFDFDFATMARVLKVPSEKMRDKIYQSLSEYMTTMTRCLGSVPDREHVVGIYVEHCAQALGRDIAPGRLTDKELALAAELDAQFASDAWLHQKGGLRQSGVRIHEDVRVAEGAHKAPGGLIRVTARLAAGRIDDVSLSGDFTMLPASALGALEEGLRGAPLERDALRARVTGVYTSAGIQSPGVTPDDLVTAVLQVLPADAR